MPTREQVLAAVGSGLSYEEAGRRLGVPAGQAYLVATGLPADGGDSLAPEDKDRPGILEGSTQHLLYPAPDHPTHTQHVHEWMQRRAAADTQMQAAAAARDAAPAPVGSDEASPDLVDVLTRHHNQVDALVKQLKTVPGAKDGGSPVQLSRRKSIVDMVTVRLSQHEAAEQEYLWPAVRRVLPDGDGRADTALAQEQEGKDLLTALGRLDGTEEEFDELVQRLATAAHTHVAFEDAVFLDLTRAMPEEERRELGERLRRAHATAPTRPHPHAPKRPAGAVKAAGAAAAAVDKLRDTVGERPAGRKGKGRH